MALEADGDLLQMPPSPLVVETNVVSVWLGLRFGPRTGQLGRRLRKKKKKKGEK